jgi:hypothetical protein
MCLEEWPEGTAGKQRRAHPSKRAQMGWNGGDSSHASRLYDAGHLTYQQYRPVEVKSRLLMLLSPLLAQHNSIHHPPSAGIADEEAVGTGLRHTPVFLDADATLPTLGALQSVAVFYILTA